MDAPETAIWGMSADDLLSAIREWPGKTGRAHSPVFQTLWDHFDTLAPALNPPQTPNWAALAKRLADRGVTDGKGQPPKASVVRVTWWKVKKAKAMGKPPQGAPMPAPLPPANKLSSSKTLSPITVLNDDGQDPDEDEPFVLTSISGKPIPPRR